MQNEMWMPAALVNCQPPNTRGGKPVVSTPVLDPTKTTSSNERWMTACLINCQSAGNKAFTIKDYVVDNDFDVAFLCETWLASSRQRVCGELTPAGYRLRALNRSEKRGGGVAVLHKASVRVNEVMNAGSKSVEGIGHRTSSWGYSRL
jgi:hypothetical protein